MAQSDTPLQISDPLAELASREEQQQAARHAQDAFAQVLRATLGGDEEEGAAPDLAARREARHLSVSEAGKALRQWTHGGKAQGEGASLRLALVMVALDQWGIAYGEAFGQAATVGVSELLGVLRNALSAEEEARCQRFFAAINDTEMSAFDFKVDMRRELHLALWHAMIASDKKEDADTVLRQLGGMMVALTKAMPETGWRLVVDTLAHIQIRCLAHALAIEGIAQESTQELFAGFSRELDKELRDRIMAHATQVVLAWQDARRNMH